MKEFRKVIEKLQGFLETSKPALAGLSELEATNASNISNPKNTSNEKSI
jgi:phage I-like protein